MILSNNIVGKISVPESPQGIVVIVRDELEDVTVSESVDGSVIVCGGVALI